MAVAAATAGLALSLGSGATVAAARDAGPGHALYGVKRALEEAQLALPASDGTRVRQHLAFGARRLSEVEHAVGEAGLVAELVAAYEAHLKAAARAAGDDSALQTVVAAATHGAQEELTWLLDEGLPARVSARARQALEQALTRLAERHGPAAAPHNTSPRRQGAPRPSRALPPPPAQTSPAPHPHGAQHAALASSGRAPRASQAMEPHARRSPAAGQAAAGSPGAARDSRRPAPSQTSSTAQPGGGFPPPSPGAGHPSGGSRQRAP